MELVATNQGEFTVVNVTGRLDAVTAPDFEKECTALMEQGSHNMILDLSGLEYISSAGLRGILSSAKKLKAEQGEMRFCGLQGMVQEVFSISGFQTMFKVFDSVEAALG